MTTPLITLAEIKAFIPTNENYTENDHLYKRLAVQATKMIEQYTRREFTKQTFVEYFGTRKAGRHSLDLYGSGLTGYNEVNEVQKFHLKNAPVDMAAGFHVYFDLNRVWGAGSELSADIYWVDEKSGILAINTFVGKTEHTLKVEYSAGYAAATANGETTLSAAAPSDLKLACLITTVNLFNRTQDRSFGVVQVGETDEHADRTHHGIIPLEARDLLNPYRKILVRS